MKTREKYTRPAEEFYLTRYTCDRCGKPCGRDEADSSRGGVSKVEISMDEGERYPGGAHIDRTIVDCCTECFRTIVLPALIAAGFKPRVDDVGY